MRYQKSYRTPRNMGRRSQSGYGDSRESYEYDREMRGLGEERWGNLEGGGSEPSSYGRKYPSSGSPYSPYARESEYSEFGSREPSRSSYGSEREWRPGYSDESTRSSSAYGTSGTSRNAYESDRFGSERDVYGRSLGSSRYGEERGYEMNQYQQGRYGSQYGYENNRYTNEGQRRMGGQFAGRGPKGYKRSDERIKEEVCEMLTRDPSVDAENIEIEVHEGEVTLSGSVPERSMKHMAEDCAERCFGVTDVTNNLRVKKESESSMESSSRSSTSSSSRRSSGSSVLNS